MHIRHLFSLLFLLPSLASAQTYHGMFYDKNQTVSATHTFNPTVPGTPYVYGGNVQTQPLPLGTPGALPSPNAIGRMMEMGSGSATGAPVFDNGSSWNCETAYAQKIAIPVCPPWNAIGDGSTDDTSRVQGALNSGLPKIWLGNFTYSVGGLTIPSTVHFIDSDYVGGLKQKTAGTDILTGTNTKNLAITNVVFTCQAGNGFTSGNNGIVLTSSGGSATGAPGDVAHIYIGHNVVRTCQHRGIYVAYADDVAVVDNFDDTGSSGPAFFSVTNARMSRNRVNARQYTGATTILKVDTELNTPSGTQHNARVNIEDNIVTDTTFAQAVLLHDCTSCHVALNHILNTLQGIYIAPVGGGTQVVQHVKASENTVVIESTVQHLGNSQYCVAFSGDGAGNVLLSPTVVGNTCVGANAANQEANVGAIMLQGATDGATVGTNRIYTTFGEGIIVNGTTANTNLQIHGNNTSPVTAVGGTANCIHVASANNTGDITKNACNNATNGVRLDGFSMTGLTVTDNMNGASVTTPLSSGATITLVGYRTTSTQHQSFFVTDNGLSSLGTLDIGSTGQLHVAADGSITDAGALQFTAASGRLGIRQLSPAGALHVTDASSRAILDTLATRFSNSGGNPLLECVDQGSGTTKQCQWNAASYIYQLGGTEKFRMDASGFFAVGGPASLASAGNGDLVMPTARGLRSANNAGSGTFQLIGSNSSDQVVLSPDGNAIKLGKATVALGGGAAATLGTIGGSGPGTAAQFAWEPVTLSDGSSGFLPVWK